MVTARSAKWRNTARRREIAIALALIVAAAVFAFVVIPAGVVKPASVKRLPLSPVFLPYVLTGLVALFAALHLLEAWLAPDAIAAPPDASQETHPRWKLRIAVLCACLAGYLFLPDVLGMLATAIIVTIALMALMSERNPLILIGVGVLLPTLVWLFFTQVAQVPLPLGIFESLFDGWR